MVELFGTPLQKIEMFTHPAPTPPEPLTCLLHLALYRLHLALHLPLALLLLAVLLVLLLLILPGELPPRLGVGRS